MNSTVTDKKLTTTNEKKHFVATRERCGDLKRRYSVFIDVRYRGIIRRDYIPRSTTAAALNYDVMHRTQESLVLHESENDRCDPLAPMANRYRHRL